MPIDGGVGVWELTRGALWCLAQGDAGDTDQPWKQWLFLAGVLILIFTTVRLGLRRKQDRSDLATARAVNRSLSESRDRGAAGGAPAAADAPRASVDRETARELRELLGEIHEVGREIEARLDTKARFVQKLVGEAESVLARLESATRNASQFETRSVTGGVDEAERGSSERGSSERGPSESGPTPAALFASPATPSTPEAPVTETVPIDAVTTPEVAESREEEVVPVPEETTAPTSSVRDDDPTTLDLFASGAGEGGTPSAGGGDPNSAEILELARAGYDAEAIAAKLYRHFGEVRLVLSIAGVKR